MYDESSIVWQAGHSCRSWLGAATAAGCGWFKVGITVSFLVLVDVAKGGVGKAHHLPDAPFVMGDERKESMTETGCRVKCKLLKTLVLLFILTVEAILETHSSEQSWADWKPTHPLFSAS